MTDPTGPLALDIEDVRLAFGGIVALAGVSVKVGAGEIVGLIGPNGSGKTSLVNVLSGFYQPTSGSIRFFGDRLDGRTPQSVRRMGITRVFQNLRLYNDMTVLENLELAVCMDMSTGGQVGRLLVTALSVPWRHDRARRRLHHQLTERLDQHGLADIADRTVGHLSYGQRKEVELVRAMVASPRLLLLDEPTAGVSTPEAERIRQQILDWQRDTGTTVLIVEHRLEWLFGLAPRILVLNDGMLLADDRPERIAKDPAVKEAYIGVGIS